VSISVPRRWTSQPADGRQRINWSHPLAQGLVYYDQLAPASRNVAGAGFGTLTGTRIQPGRYGMARGFGATLGAATTDRVVTGLKTHAPFRTYAIRGFKNGAGGSSSRLWTKEAVTDTERLIHLNADGFFYRSASTTGSEWKWVDVWNYGEWRHVVITMDRSVTESAPLGYIDGRLRTRLVATSPSGAWSTSTDPFVIGNRATDGARVFDGILQDFQVWDRILSAGEIAALYENPWQFIEPQRRVIYSLAAGPTAPTLSLPGVVDVTATSAQPQVTLTY
jgi:hypothetical protein